MEIEGVGPNIALAIVDWFGNPANQKVLSKLQQAGIWPERSTNLSTSGGGRLGGSTFVVTGTLQGFSREEAREYILKHGGKLSESVGKNTDFLVLGENPGSKLDKARQLNVRIIDEGELKAMAEGN